MDRRCSVTVDNDAKPVGKFLPDYISIQLKYTNKIDWLNLPHGDQIEFISHLHCLH